MLRLSALNDDGNNPEESELAAGDRREEKESKILSIYNQALNNQRNGNLMEAKQLYNDILQSDLIAQCPDPSEFEPQDVRVHSGLLLKYNVYKNLGGMAFHAEEYDSAIELCLEAALIDESDVSLWWKIGEAALKVTNARLARYAFEKGLNCSPKHGPCLHNLVTVLYVIGDYTACLKLIAQELDRNDFFIKGLAIRDQIFKEEPHLKRDFYGYKSLFLAKSRTETHEDEYQKIIEEALFLREKRRLLSRREELPKVRFGKPFSHFSWACLGDCLLHLYDEVTDAEQKKSLCWPVDLEKYRRTPEQQESLSLPSPELKKATKGTHKDSDDKRGVKRKKASPSRNLESSTEPVPKRRSARQARPQKPKEEDVNWSETLFGFLPDFARLESSAETEDSQDSLGGEHETMKSSAQGENRVQLLDEAKKVSNFINQKQRNSGCLDLMNTFLRALVDSYQTSWPSTLPGIYVRIYKKIRKQICFPSAPVFSRDASNAYYAEFTKALLLALECQLDLWLQAKSRASVGLPPGQKTPKGTNESQRIGLMEGTREFVEDSHYLLLCIACRDIFQDAWAEFNVRFFWLQARFHMLQSESEQAINYFERGIDALTPGTSRFLEDHPSLTVKLHHCQLDNVITLENVKKKLEELERCQSLEEVNKLYESGSYSDVVNLLMPLLRQTRPVIKPDEVNSACPERPSQLLLLQESLYKLQEYKKCLVCSEIMLNEAVQLLMPCEAWTSILERLFTSLNRLLQEHNESLDLIGNDITKRLIRNLVKVIEFFMEAFDANETHVTTVQPWLILYRIVKHFDKKKPPEGLESNRKEVENSCSQEAYPSMPSYLRFMKASHDHLGRRSICCDNKGILLLQYVLDIHSDLHKEFPPAVRKELSRELEQCLFCLYGHPSRKSKNKWLQDHNSDQVSLTWEYAHIVYDFFKPAGLPELESKIHTISVEVQNVLRRLVAVVPQREVEVISFEDLQAFIDGTKDLQVPQEPEVTSKGVIVQNLFYLLGDFYFKNKEFSKAVKFYMHDVCLNPERFESWAAMALARGSRLEEKIRACEPKSDGPIKKHIISTLRCFERAVSINSSNCMILEEYGSTAYMLNSHASRRLREQWQDEEFTSEAQASFLARKSEMLRLAESCFTKANECLRTTEGEPWLHSYMLGKAAEKLGKAPEIYLAYYEKAGRDLHKARASYPKRIPYHGAPEYAIEVLELYYRIHSSILNIIEKSEGDLDFETLEGYLDRASQVPFAQNSLHKEAKSATPGRPPHSSPVKRQTSVDKSPGQGFKGHLLAEGTQMRKSSSVQGTATPPSCVKSLTFSLVAPSEDPVGDDNPTNSFLEPVSGQEDSTYEDDTMSSAREEITLPSLEAWQEASQDTDQPSRTVGGLEGYSEEEQSTQGTQFGQESAENTSLPLRADDTKERSLLTPPKMSLTAFDSIDDLAWDENRRGDEATTEPQIPVGTSVGADSSHRVGVKRRAQGDSSEWSPLPQSIKDDGGLQESDFSPGVTAKPSEAEKAVELSGEALKENKVVASYERTGTQLASTEPLPSTSRSQDAIQTAALTNKICDRSCEQKTGDEQCDLEEITSVSQNGDGKPSSEDAKGDSGFHRSSPSGDVKRAYVHIEAKYPRVVERCKRLIDRCLAAFSYCLKRFPEHYKSQYRMAYVVAYYSTHKDLHWCRDLLLGGNASRPVPLPAHGLFTDKKRTNLFQYLWRIPIDEIDRPGSFCSHICRAVELLLTVLWQLHEWDTLLLVSAFLHRTPDKDKKYLRDNDRAFLAIKAFDLALLILKGRLKQMKEIGSDEIEGSSRLQLVLDCCEAYKHAQRMQTSTSTTEHVLIKAYRDWLEKSSDLPASKNAITVDHAIKFCIAQADNLKKASQASVSGTQSAQGVDNKSSKSVFAGPSVHAQGSSATDTTDKSDSNMSIQAQMTTEDAKAQSSEKDQTEKGKENAQDLSGGGQVDPNISC